jgi:type IV secretory pathway VirB2 component (pilin)
MAHVGDPVSGRWLAVWLAILAGLQVIAGATSLPELVPAYAAQWVQLIVGALDAATAVYVGRVASLNRSLS